MEIQNDNNQNSNLHNQMKANDIPLVERLGIHPILFALLSLGIIFILYQIVGGVVTLLIFGLKPTPENLNGYRIVTGAGQILLILLPTLVLVRFATFEPKKYLRLSPPSFKMIITSIVAIISLEQMLQVFLAFQEKLPLPTEMQKLMDQFKQMFEELYKYLLSSTSIPELIFVIVIIALIPAFAEELLFRGLIQRSIEKATSPMRSAVITGIIFGAYHFNPFSFIPLAAIGIFLGFLTVRTGSIWTSVIAHFINNFLACLAVYFHMDDDYVGFGETSSMSNEMLLVTFWFFGVIFLLSIFYLYKITRSKNVTPGEEIPESISNNGVKDE
ncbi:MAG: CPBP family intramembrane metalloprotease [Ignavibacteriales bacterium]|nr:CPBP family intramembrane metalloprotease [Ignavibacteriales bacterium]